MGQVYEPHPGSCAQVRRDVLGFLTVAGLPEATIEAALMVANELASNAIDHARTPFRLVLCVTGRCLRVEVTDGSTAAPLLQPIDTSARRGRGLQMVEHVSTSWTYVIIRNGKTVAAEVAVAAN